MNSQRLFLLIPVIAGACLQFSRNQNTNELKPRSVSPTQHLLNERQPQPGSLESPSPRAGDSPYGTLPQRSRS